MEGFNMRGTLIALEYSYIDGALAVTQNNVAKAAELLQIKRTTLVEKIRAREMRTMGGLYDLASPYSEIKTDSSGWKAPSNQTNNRENESSSEQAHHSRDGKIRRGSSSDQA